MNYGVNKVSKAKVTEVTYKSNHVKVLRSWQNVDSQFIWLTYDLTRFNIHFFAQDVIFQQKLIALCANHVHCKKVFSQLLCEFSLFACYLKILFRCSYSYTYCHTFTFP